MQDSCLHNKEESPFYCFLQFGCCQSSSVVFLTSISHMLMLCINNRKTLKSNTRDNTDDIHL